MKLLRLIIPVFCLILLYATPVLAMQITVNSYIGTNFQLDVEPSDTIQNLKGKIQKEKGFPVAQQRLVFDGKELEDSRTLADYKIQKEGIILLILKTVY